MITIPLDDSDLDERIEEWLDCQFGELPEPADRYDQPDGETT